MSKSDDEKSLTENLADAQDVLYTLEESARGLRTQMRSNGWQDETSELIASQWFSRTMAMSLDHAAPVPKDTGGQLLLKVLAVTAALLALPVIIFVSIAGFRWALG